MITYYFFSRPIHTYLDAYGISLAEERFGAGRINSEYEEKIKAIADTMGLHELIVIRKMNHKALMTLGYNNALVYFPQIFNLIPLSNKPFLFVSEGFFEDLSQEEQLFLIGHELVHAKYRHLLYAILIMVLATIVVFGIFYLMVKPLVNRFVSQYVFGSYGCSFKWVFYIGLFFVISLTARIIYANYKRSIEWQADRESISLLKSYDGGIKFFERCVREYRQPWHHKGLGFFVEHPSNYERRMYCLEVKQNECINKLKDTI